MRRAENAIRNREELKKKLDDDIDQSNKLLFIIPNILYSSSINLVMGPPSAEAELSNTGPSGPTTNCSDAGQVILAGDAVYYAAV